MNTLDLLRLDILKVKDADMRDTLTHMVDVMDELKDQTIVQQLLNGYASSDKNLCSDNRPE